MRVRIARVDHGIDEDPGGRVLVDRLWPRGMSKSAAPFETWAEDVAPSAALCECYAHIRERFEDHSRRYRNELAAGPVREALDRLRQQAAECDVVLLIATKDCGALVPG